MLEKMRVIITRARFFCKVPSYVLHVWPRLSSSTVVLLSATGGYLNRACGDWSSMKMAQRTWQGHRSINNETAVSSLWFKPRRICMSDFILQYPSKVKDKKARVWINWLTCRRSWFWVLTMKKKKNRHLDMCLKY